MDNDNRFPAGTASFLCGLVVYLAIVMATGRNEAWDDVSYYVLGLPLMCAVAFFIGRRVPVKPWRWALWMACSQAVGAVLNGSSLALLPLAMIFMVIISIPQFIAAFLGARMAVSKAAPRPPARPGPKSGPKPGPKSGR
ncbi:MAG: hypothetical protein WCY32_10730 [Burkholderiaceae bacterium]